MTINDLSVGGGSRIQLGRGIIYITGSAKELPFEWFKVSSQNDFMLARGDVYAQYDAPEPNARSREHRSGGSNYYPHSNIDQWLNSRTDTNWFQPAHEHDVGSDMMPRGFLYGFTDEEYSLLETRTVRCKNPPGSIRRHGEWSTIERKVLLPSVSEILPNHGLGNDYSDEGRLFEFARDAGYVNTLTRSSSGPGGVLARQAYRSVSTVAAARYHAVRPVIRINGSAEVDYDPLNALFVVTPPLPDITIDETEFLSLLNAR